MSARRNALQLARLTRCVCHTKPIWTRIQRRGLSIQQLNEQRNGRERVVILGSGWAGFTMSRELDPRKYQVVVVSPRSYFVFTPLLASTSVGTLEFRTALEPVRSFGARRVGAEFFQGWADAVDFEQRTLTVEEAVADPSQSRALASPRPRPVTQELQSQDSSEIDRKGELFGMSWDKLVIGVGCYTQTFNTKGVKEHAYFLKDVGDARRIRKRLLACFETASLPTTSDITKKQILNFAIVGGGPTGVEFAAELHDVVSEDMKRHYPELIKHFKTTIYDVAPKVLSMFDEKLANYAMETFKREKIDIMTDHHVEELRSGAPGEEASSTSRKSGVVPYTIKLKEAGEIGIGMCVWSTGLMMNPFVAEALRGKVKNDKKSGGIVTNSKMQVLRPDGAAVRNVFGLGDCAIMENTSYPATAQVASQKALWLARRLNKGDIEQRNFRYKDLGIMAYVGNRNGILQSAGGDISGRMAWLIWRGAYLAKSVSWRNRILIPIYWTLNWLFGRDISRF